jgi:hypothetical protein
VPKVSIAIVFAVIPAIPPSIAAVNNDKPPVNGANAVAIPIPNNAPEAPNARPLAP